MGFFNGISLGFMSNHSLEIPHIYIYVLMNAISTDATEFNLQTISLNTVGPTTLSPFVIDTLNCIDRKVISFHPNFTETCSGLVGVGVGVGVGFR